MSYHRVIPRDLFNEANFLKCLGKLALLHLDRMLPEHLQVSSDGLPFDLDIDIDGSLYCSNFYFSCHGERITLSRPLNSRDAWPLYAHKFGVGEAPVFTEDGELHPEFLEFCKALKDQK